MLERCGVSVHSNTRFGAALTAVRTSNQPIMEGSRMANLRLCRMDDCRKRVVARGMCSGHYQQWRKTACAEDVRKVTPRGEPMAWIMRHADYLGDECLPWPFGKFPTGYGMINLPNGRPGVASRYMCEVAHGPPPSASMQAAHRCGNGHQGCTNPNHLRWATRSTNEGDKILHGTSNRGRGNGHAKLDEEQVRRIRASPLGPSALSRQEGVSPPTICDIRTRRSWAWLD